VNSGAVLVVTDGVPGDLERLAHVATTRPSTCFTIVALGVSAYGLDSDGPVTGWEEELAGFALVDSVRNLQPVAVRLDEAGKLRLDGSRAAELALRITSSLPVGGQA
jgi:hypothetical protein